MKQRKSVFVNGVIWESISCDGADQADRVLNPSHPFFIELKKYNLSRFFYFRYNIK